MDHLFWEQPIYITVTKVKYIRSNDGTLTRWRHHVNTSLHNPIDEFIGRQANYALVDLQKNSYIVEACLFRFLLKFCDSRAPLGDQPYVHKMLDLLWALMQVGGTYWSN